MASSTPQPPATHPQEPARAPRWQRTAKALGKILASLLLLLTLLEVGLRMVLFSDNEGLRKATTQLRTASNFAHRWSPEYWKLLRLFADGPRRPARHDPIVGWTQDRIDLGTYDHREHDRAGGKRPVLLYGDSFAECVTGPDECWEGLLARSEFGGTHQLLNYGTGGHGFDQTFLLLRESIANYAGESPIVIVSLLVDDDMDRAILPFRAWPKPLLSIEADGSLSLPGPVHEGSLDYLDEHPPAIGLYLWRCLLHGTRLIPAAQRERWIGKADTFSETRRLNSHILEQLKTLLEGAGLEYFVLIFHGRGYLKDPATDDWREGFLLAELERLQMPYVSSRTVLAEDKRATGRRPRDYYHIKGPGKGHYDPLGNEVVFEAIRRGLEHRFEGQPDADTVGTPSVVADTAAGAFARFGQEPVRPFLAPEDSPRWVIGTAGDTPTDLEYNLQGQMRWFSAIVKVVPPAAHRNDAPIEISLWRDGTRVLVYTLETPSEPVPIEVDLTGARSLRIRVTSPAGSTGEVLLLASPDFKTR